MLRGSQVLRVSPARTQLYPRITGEERRQTDGRQGALSALQEKPRADGEPAKGLSGRQEASW